ncbi:MAG TPA: glucose 1-dehydrogenase [Pyrinomonadaceae bacterium]|nr:glucose 1-dehydrogenase [Pyrinomonadaceae bacterium]
MENDFAGKSVLVTGATSGIGRAIARRFAESWARVTAIGRNQNALSELQRTMRGEREVLTLVADVTDSDQMRRAVEQAVSTFGRLDILVNAAGHISNGTIEDTSLAAWDAMMNVNLRAVFHLMQVCAPHLIQTQGNIVNISSVTGLRSFPGVLAYCVSKAGLDQLTRCAALELAPKGVRVNAVNPGVVVTEIHKRGGMAEDTYARFLEHSRTTHPLGRVGDPSEIADLALYLASEKAAWITGATYSIDGGRALTCAR